MKKLQPIIRYFGGKNTMYNKIFEHFPEHTTYDTYIEPFAGTYGLGLKLEPIPKIEIYNDLDKNVYSLYKVLSDPKLFTEFKEKCDLAIYSEDFRNEYKEKLKSNHISIIERAFYFFYVNRSSHNGIGGFSLNTVIRRNMSKSISDFLSSIDRLPELHNRLSRVMVCNTDGIELIKRFNKPNVFFYCVPENENILINGIPQEIKNAQIGDLCGDNNKILKIHKKYSENETLIKFNVMGLGYKFPLNISENHIIFTYNKYDDTIIEKKGGDLRIGDYVLIESFLGNNSDHSTNIEFSNKKNSHKKIKYSNNLYELCELLGFYTAEGHYQNGIIFSFNSNENEYLERVQYLIKSVFNIESNICYNSPHQTVSQVRAHSNEIEDFFHTFLINGTAKNKKFTEFVMKLSSDCQIEILKAWLKGDGGIWNQNENDNINKSLSIRSGKRNKYKLTGTSASWIMINQLYQMALKCNLHPSIKPRVNAYDLYFSNKYDIEILTNIKTNGRCCKRRKWVNNFMISPITKIEKYQYNGWLYDLTTEKGYFYLNFGVKSHNCDPPYEQSTRTGTRYNVDMNRDEHIEFLNSVTNCNAKILISGYDCELYDKLIENGFTKLSFIVKTIDGNFNKKNKTEYLWKNY